MNRWEITILHIIASNAGSASLKHIYSEIPKHIDLTSNHIKITYGVPNYHHQTRAHIGDLLDNGDVNRVSRGRYSITSHGQLRIKKLSELMFPS